MSELAERLRPDRCVVLTMEVQRGVAGDLSCLPGLREAVEKVGLIENTAKLLKSARAAGIRVIHNDAAFRPDRAGSLKNVPMVVEMLKDPDHMLVGSEMAELVPEFGPEPEDLLIERLHGMSPFSGTPLDAMLRSEGARAVIATGVSLNMAILGLTIEAVNLGYEVIIPTDCVAGFPAEYGEAILANTLAYMATLTTSKEILDVWF